MRENNVTLAAWIKTASDEELRKFIWQIYNCGYYDARNNNLESDFFDNEIMERDIDDVLSILKYYADEGEYSYEDYYKYELSRDEQYFKEEE